MKRAAAALFLLVGLVAATGCRRPSAPETAASKSLAKGDAIWLAHPAAAGESAIEAELQRLNSALLFVTAGEVVFDSGRWILEKDPAPPGALERIPVVLVVRAGPELAAALLAPEGRDLAGPAKAVADAFSPAIGSKTPYGSVAGVHLDVPFTAPSAPRYAELVSALRRLLAPHVFISISMHASPASEEERKQFAPLVEAADALVAFVFGTGGRVDPAVTDSLQRPWWAAYEVVGQGFMTSAGGGTPREVPENLLNRLSGQPGFEFENDLSVNDPSVSAFNLIARRSLRVDDLALEPGDRIAFRLPALPELLFQLGSTTMGKRFALGRIIVLGGANEADRVFPIAAFEDVLLGRTLTPALEASVKPAGRNAVTVSAENRSPHASMVSRMSNWVEIDLAPAHPGDVQLGGFDRYEVYNAGGRAVSPGRATRVRLFTTLVAPREVIHPARIVVRGALPRGCCRTRLHLIAAAGAEVATDWSDPAAAPAPIAQAPPKANRK